MAVLIEMPAMTAMPMRWMLAGSIVLAFASGCRPASDAKVRVTYWEKWTGFEASAMQQVVDQFNRSQDRIVVEFLSVSQVDRKTIVATAGGDPPDLAGLWLYNIYSFVDRDALTPLDELIAADGISRQAWLDRFTPAYADVAAYRGRVWGTVSTPSGTALHWNKAMFRAAGLDPDRPPRTLAELDEFAERLTQRDPRTGEILQMGFLPQEPNWFSWAYPLWFGGGHWDGTNITFATRPENLECYRWVAGYTKKYGLEPMRSFAAGFGNFASPQNPFMAGKVAMVLQGVWMDNYIRQYAPGLDYGVAPWPVARPGLENFSVVDADVLAIPRGAKHPKEAWEFIKFLLTPNPSAQRFEELTGIELLCYLQRKHSPLRRWSPVFEREHPHPHIAMFRQLAQAPNAVHVPKIGIWQEYGRELTQVFDTTRLLIQPPEEALAFCQKRIAESWQWHRRSVARREEQP